MYTPSANKIEKTPVLQPLAFQWKETDNKVKQARNKVIWAGAKCSEARKQQGDSLGQGAQAGPLGGRVFGVRQDGEDDWESCSE